MKIALSVLFIVIVATGVLWFLTYTDRAKEKGSPPPGNAIRSIPMEEYTGKVFALDGRPLAGVQVDALSLPFKVQGKTRSATNLSGRFTIELPRDYPARVALKKDGYIREEVELLPSSLSEMDRRYTLYRGARLDGFVYDEFDRPISGARVEAAGMHGFRDELVTDDGGHFTLFGTPGAIVLTIHSTMHADARILDLTLSRDEQPKLDFVLASGSTLELKVMGGGRPLAGARVQVTTDFGELSTVLTDNQGKATVPGLESGTLHVLVVRSGYAALSTEINLDQDSGTLVRALELEAAHPWALKILGPEGNEVDEATITLVGERRQTLAKTLDPGDEALQVIGKLRRYTVEVRAAGLPTCRHRFRSDDLEDGTLVVKLARGGRILGRVMDGIGVEVEGARIIVTHSSSSTRSPFGVDFTTTTSSLGRFRTELLEVGTYALRISHPDVGRRKMDFIVEADREQDLGDIVIDRK